MSKRIDKNWLVFASIDNAEQDRCIDMFRRPDQTFGFEEFRRDVEDAGAWTPTQFFSARAYRNCDAAYEAASATVGWFRERIEIDRGVRRLP